MAVFITNELLLWLAAFYVLYCAVYVAQLLKSIELLQIFERSFCARIVATNFEFSFHLASSINFHMTRTATQEAFLYTFQSCTQSETRPRMLVCCFFFSFPTLVWRASNFRYQFSISSISTRPPEKNGALFDSDDSSAFGWGWISVCLCGVQPYIVSHSFPFPLSVSMAMVGKVSLVRCER